MARADWRGSGRPRVPSYLAVGIAMVALAGLLVMETQAANGQPAVDRQMTPVPTVDVNQAPDVFCGSSLLADTRGQPSNVATYACRSDWDESGPEAVFQFHFLEAQPVTISLASLLPAVDPDVFLLTLADPVSLSLIHL